MKITEIRAWRVTPPQDAWLLLSIATDAGIIGWGEFTGSGHDAAAIAVLKDAATALMGRDALDAEALLSPYRAFRYPPLRDKIAAVAWSGIAQALWDIRARAFGQPLCRLLGGTPKPVRAYANLNRGLFRDRSPEGHARHAEKAMAAGFAYAKCTPFDDVTPSVLGAAALVAPLERLRKAAAAVGSDRIAVDCHCRLAPGIARRMLDELRAIGPFAWIEDVIPDRFTDLLPEMRSAFPEIVWAGGEETLSLVAAAELLAGPDRPDIFMPDIKYLCGPDEYAAIALLSKGHNVPLYPHNPSGPVSLAFSAHLAALGTGGVIEYPFMAVPGQKELVAPPERLENGWYHIGDDPGIGVVPSEQCLAEHGTAMFAIVN